MNFFLQSTNFLVKKTATIFYFMYYFLNDFVILIFNLAIDLSLVRIIKAQLKEKLKAKYSKETKVLNKLEKKKMEEEIKKKSSVERKSNAMIVLNVVIYLFCRLPELCGVIVMYFYDLILQKVGRDEVYNISDCSLSEECYYLSNTIEYFYMLSYIFNIFLYYNFNSNFNKGLRNYLGIQKK